MSSLPTSLAAAGQPPRFLEFPPEIRHIIYSYLFASDSTFRLKEQTIIVESVRDEDDWPCGVYAQCENERWRKQQDLALEATRFMRSGDDYILDRSPG